MPLTPRSIATAPTDPSAAATSTPSADDAPYAPVAVASDLLGPLELPAEALYTFPTGLYAFDGLTRWALVPAGREGLFWLQSAERSGLVFLLADPFHWFPGYEADLPDAELAQLEIARPEQLALLVIVTLPGAPGETASANLRAPIVLDPLGRRGRQLVLPDDRHPTRAPLALG
jgi:flagellar assembly factor FliW